MNEELIIPKYAFKHFLIVGLLAGIGLTNLLKIVVLYPLAMIAIVVYPNVGLVPSTIAICVLSLFSIYMGNIFFAKKYKTVFIPKEQILKASLYFFSLYLFLFLIKLKSIFSITCWPTDCTTSTYMSGLIPELVYVIIIPLGFLIIGRRYFAKKEL